MVIFHNYVNLPEGMLSTPPVSWKKNLQKNRHFADFALRKRLGQRPTWSQQVSPGRRADVSWRQRWCILRPPGVNQTGDNYGNSPYKLRYHPNKCVCIYIYVHLLVSLIIHISIISATAPPSVDRMHMGSMGFRLLLWNMNGLCLSHH